MRRFVQVDLDLLDSVGLLGLGAEVGGEGKALLALVRFWGWVLRQERADGDLSGIEDRAIEAVAGVKVAALVNHGFLRGEPLAREVVGWRERYSNMEHKRALWRERSRRYRDRSSENRHAVTHHVTRESRTMSRVSHATEKNTTTVRQLQLTSSSKDKNKNSLTLLREEGCGEKGDPTYQPGLPTFPCAGITPEWRVPADLYATWQQAYPALDLDAEIRKAFAWVTASSDRRKTARGMPRFLVGWLNRSNDRGPRHATPAHDFTRRGPDGLTISEKPPEGDPGVRVEQLLIQAEQTQQKASQARQAGATKAAEILEQQVAALRARADALRSRNGVGTIGT